MPITRDSKILKVIQVSSLVLGVLANTINDPASYGLTAVGVKWISLASVVFGTISGFLGTSPLKGETSATKARRSARRK